MQHSLVLTAYKLQLKLKKGCTVVSHCQNLKQTIIFSLPLLDNLSTAIYPLDAHPNLYPVKIVGDGNCLFRSFSLAVFGTESYHLEMRTRAIVELICHSYHYLSCEAMFHADDNQLMSWLSRFSSTRETAFLGMPNHQNIFQVLKGVII